MALAVIISVALLVIVAGRWLLELALWGLAIVFRAVAWTAVLLLWLGWATLNPREAAAEWSKAEHLRKAGLLAGSRLTARP